MGQFPPRDRFSPISDNLSLYNETVGSDRVDPNTTYEKLMAAPFPA